MRDMTPYRKLAADIEVTKIIEDAALEMLRICEEEGLVHCVDEIRPQDSIPA